MLQGPACPLQLVGIDGAVEDVDVALLVEEVGVSVDVEGGRVNVVSGEVVGEEVEEVASVEVPDAEELVELWDWLPDEPVELCPSSVPVGGGVVAATLQLDISTRNNNSLNT